MAHLDEFQKFKFNFKVYPIELIWTIWMEMDLSKWYNVYYTSNIIYKLQT